jgi:putative membrane protein
MMPELFQKLCPLLPFTYGINAMREAIAGMYKDYYVKNLLALVIYLLIALFIGLVLRPLLMNLNRFFDDRLSEAEIMVGETASMGHDWPKLHLILHAMLNDEEGKADIIQRSLRFETLYPKLIRFGFRSLLVIPSLFLILMFTLEYKLVFLVLWILILIAVAIYLICVEYFHEQIQQQLALSGLTLDDLLQKIQEEKQ